MAVDEQFWSSRTRSRLVECSFSQPPAYCLPKAAIPHRAYVSILTEIPCERWKYQKHQKYQFILCRFCFIVKSPDYRMRAIFVSTDLILDYVSHDPVGCLCCNRKSRISPFRIFSWFLSLVQKANRVNARTADPKFFWPLCRRCKWTANLYFYMIHF